MEFKQRLKIRFYTAFVMIAVGAAMMAVGYFKAVETASSCGLMFVVVGAARLIQHRRITRSPEALHAREVAETDERSVMIWTKARSAAFTVYVLAAAVASIALHLMEKTVIANTVALTLFAFVAVYWACYFFIRRKY